MILRSGLMFGITNKKTQSKWSARWNGWRKCAGFVFCLWMIEARWLQGASRCGRCGTSVQVKCLRGCGHAHSGATAETGVIPMRLFMCNQGLQPGSAEPVISHSHRLTRTKRRTCELFSANEKRQTWRSHIASFTILHHLYQQSTSLLDPLTPTESLGWQLALER